VYANYIGDGIFDRLSTEDIGQLVWKLRKASKNVDCFTFCKSAVDEIIKVALERQTFDNVTGVLIAFNSLNPDEDAPNLIIKSNSRNGEFRTNTKMKTNYLEIIDDASQRFSLQKLLNRSRPKNIDRNDCVIPPFMNITQSRLAESRIGNKVKIKLSPLKRV
jgi:hypothetical protein